MSTHYAAIHLDMCNPSHNADLWPF